MGIQVSLEAADNSMNVVFFRKDFTQEVCLQWYVNFGDVFTEQEQKIIEPNKTGEIIIGQKRKVTTWDKIRLPWILYKAMKGKKSLKDIQKYRANIWEISEKIEDRARDPILLKQALQKLENHMILHHERYPVVHELYNSPARNESNEVFGVTIDGINAAAEGDLFFYEAYEKVRNNIHIKSYLEDYEKVDFYVEVAPEVSIGGRTYFAKTITKAEQFQAQFQLAYAFLDQAIEKGKKVLWEFG